MYVNSFLRRLKRLPASVGRWTSRHRYEILAVLIVVSVGAALRTYRLDSIPVGLHGDEATNGLIARLILDGDWAETYDLSANGRPTGFLFWLAGFTAVFGSSLFTLRLASATLAILTIPCAYLFFRAVDGRATAIIGSSLLAVSGWHLLYSRTAWEQSLLVLIEVVAGLFLVLAVRREQRWLFGVAGFVLGLGLYTHSSYPFFLIGACIWLGIWLVTKWRNLSRALVLLATLAGTFFLAALPMLSYIKDNQREYFRRSRGESIFNSERFESASGPLDQLDVVFDSGRHFVELLMVESPPVLPSIALPVAILLGVGLVLAVWRWRQTGIALAVSMLFVLPLAGILLLSGDSITIRRTVGVTPFVALLAAMPLAAALRSKWLAHPALRVAGLALVTGLLVYVGNTNRSYYFDEFHPRATTNHEITDASLFINSLPGDPYVYFYSIRTGYDYEVRRFLASDVEGEDRSGAWGSEFDLTPDRSRDVVYVFMDRFRDSRDEVAAMFPGGLPLDHTDGDESVLFTTYELSRDVSLPPEAEARDLARWRDLQAIADALDRYQRQHGGYPDTAGQRQTLCVFRTLDVGCALDGLLSPIPMDPLGDPGANGYWFVSTVDKYALYARRETGRLPACLEFYGSPPAIESLLCLVISEKAR